MAFKYVDKNPVEVAVICDIKKCLEPLLTAGADVNHKDKEGKNALIHATMSDECMSLNLLLKVAADVKSYDNYGFTPLLALVAYHGQPGMLTCAKELLAAGAALNKITNTGILQLCCWRETLTQTNDGGRKTVVCRRRGY